jgi:hypothetical protein
VLQGLRQGARQGPAAAAAIIKAIDDAVIQEQKPSYPLQTCVISGEQLGSMGDPIEMVHGTRLARLCCKGCVKGFQKDPAAALAKVDAELIAVQKKAYPLTTCIVSGTALGDASTDQLYGVRLTRFCSEKCAATFAQDPAKYLVVLEKAAPKKN